MTHITRQSLNYLLWLNLLGLKETAIFKMKTTKINYMRVPTLKTKIELYNRRNLNKIDLYIDKDNVLWFP